MATKVEERTYEDAVAWLRDHAFDLIEAPGTQNRVFLKKYNRWCQPFRRLTMVA